MNFTPRLKKGQIRDLNIVLKGDVQGSVEAIKSAFEVLPMSR